MTQLYTATIRSTVKYASTVWDPHTCRNTNKLEQVQRHSARYVTGNRDYNCSASRMVQDLGWPTLEQRRRNSRLTVMYKIINHQVDIAFSSRCSLSQSITRSHASRIVQPQCAAVSHTPTLSSLALPGIGTCYLFDPPTFQFGAPQQISTKA